MYVEKLTIKVFTDYQIKGKKPQSDLIGEFTSQSVGTSNDKLEELLEAIMSLYEFDPVRLVVSFETENN
tara:strand:+ start:330 stop:536 length:207 start_codon:yes stop_codon:yes gene_type:complete